MKKFSQAEMDQMSHDLCNCRFDIDCGGICNAVCAVEVAPSEGGVLLRFLATHAPNCAQAQCAQLVGSGPAPQSVPVPQSVRDRIARMSARLLEKRGHAFKPWRLEKDVWVYELLSGELVWRRFKV